MKIRLGHVTNSSSSSFLVAFKTPTSKTMSTPEELIAYLNKGRGVDTLNLMKYKEYIEGIELINEGLHIAFVEVDDSEPDLPQILKDLGLDAYVREMPL